MQGRWLSPDPSGLAAVDPTNPQSWNRYVYALNNPLRYTDPLGLYCFYGGPGDTPWNDSDPTDFNFDEFGAAGQNDCAAEGGAWYQDYTSITVNGDQSGDVGTTIENGQQIFPLNCPPGGKATPGQRVAAGIQGTLNFGLGEFKSAGIGIGGGALAVGGAPETLGASLLAAPVVLYGVTSSQGQALGGMSQLYTAFSGNTNEQLTQAADIMSGPLTGITTLAVTGGNAKLAQKVANAESAITAWFALGKASAPSEKIASAVDLGLSMVGLGSSGCQQ